MTIITQCPSCGSDHVRHDMARFNCKACGHVVSQNDVIRTSYCANCRGDILEKARPECLSPDSHLEVTWKKAD